LTSLDGTLDKVANDQGPSDIPLLSHMLDTARQFLSNLPSMSGDTERAKRPELRVGFVGPLMRKLQCP
jgi:hypothetical protein